MEILTALQIIWFLLIGVLFAGYAVLDGFDLGAGSLIPFLAGKDEKKTELVINTIGPVWDGNEVWLITAGGALFAAFPHAYATVFSGFYLALMIVIFGLIFRAVSIKFFSLEPEGKKGVWAKAFFAGSLVPALLFGVALGNVIVGVPLDSRMEFTGSFLTLLRPFPLATGLLGLSAILLQGASYIALKTEGEMRERAISIMLNIWRMQALFFVVALALSFIYIPERMNIAAWISGTIALAMMVLYRRTIDSGQDMKKFIYSSVSFVSLWGIAGAVQFPALVKAAGNADLDITIYNASSSQLTLGVMLGIAAVGMPAVIAYSIYIYRIFRGRVKG